MLNRELSARLIESVSCRTLPACSPWRRVMRDTRALALELTSTRTCRRQRLGRAAMSSQKIVEAASCTKVYERFLRSHLENEAAVAQNDACEFHRYCVLHPSPLLRVYLQSLQRSTR